MGIMTILLISWIVCCGCSLLSTFVSDYTKPEDNDLLTEAGVRYANFWSHLSSCVSISLVALPFLIFGVISEQGIKGIKEANMYNARMNTNTFQK